MASDASDGRTAGKPTGLPQVLLNYARGSRGPWRLRALIDPKGRAVSSAFISVRPKDAEATPIHFLWALLNSPFANAYAHCHCERRHNLVGTIQRMPVPAVPRREVRAVSQLAAECFGAFAEFDRLRTPPAAESARRALLKMDAEILRLFDLPPRVERLLLDYFASRRRAGVPFPFDRFYPEEFQPAIPLRLYISPEYAKTTAGALAARFQPAPEPVLQALGDDEE